MATDEEVKELIMEMVRETCQLVEGRVAEQVNEMTSNSTALNSRVDELEDNVKGTGSLGYMYYIELKCTANLPGETYTITGELANKISFKVPIYTNFLIH